MIEERIQQLQQRMQQRAEELVRNDPLYQNFVGQLTAFNEVLKNGPTSEAEDPK